VFSLELALGATIILDALGIQMPILRSFLGSFLGFVFLTFTPGATILRLLKLDKLSTAESFVYTIGLSLAFTMFTGYFINNIMGHVLKIPISRVNIFIVTAIAVTFMCIVCYFKEKDIEYQNCSSKLNQIYTPMTLLLILMPFLSIFGAYLLNFYNNNILLAILFFLIIFVILIAIDGKHIKEDLYPLVIFVIAISTLYQNSLSSTYLDGYDIHREYYFANLVKLSGFWNYNLKDPINNMLSIVMVAPIYSELCNLDLTEVFKIIYPFLFSVLPVGIYVLCKSQIKNGKASLLSAFYFISIFSYFTEMLALARQQIAELFFVLIVITMVSEIELVKRRFLIFLFSIALITSHYGLSYLFLFISIFGYIFMHYILKQRSTTYYPGYLFFFFAFSMFWYIVFAGRSNFETIILLFHNVIDNFSREIFSPSHAMSIATSKPSDICNTILKLLYWLSQFLILIGLSSVYLNRKKNQFSSELFSISLMLLWVLIVSLSTSRTGMSINRLYHITAILLSLFFVIGGTSLLQVAQDIIYKKSYMHPSQFIQGLKDIVYFEIPSTKIIKILTLFCIIFFLFNVGVPQEFFKGQPILGSFNRDLILNSQNSDTQYQFYTLHFLDQDVYGSRWVSHYRNPKIKIYGDEFSTKVLFYSYGTTSDGDILGSRTIMEPHSYLYLRYPNVNYGLMRDRSSQITWKLKDISKYIYKKDLIYSNKDNLIYK
jgi:uncharacterized membrane protein